LSRRRGLLAVGVLAVGATVALLGAVALGFGQDPAMGGVVCLVDPGGSNAEGPCPPTVIPPERPDSATVTVTVNAQPSGMEGGHFFMRATSADGQVVAEQRLEFRRDEPAEPAASGVQPPPPTATGEAYLPAGPYEFTVYGRNCSASCDFLMPPDDFCVFPIILAANQHLTIDYDGSDCTLDD
jgi:hypothetical protein